MTSGSRNACANYTQTLPENKEYRLFILFLNNKKL